MMPPKKKRGRRPDPKSLRSQGVDRHAHPRKAFHAPAELFARLTAYCKRTKRPEADAIREALDEYLKRQKS